MVPLLELRVNGEVIDLASSLIAFEYEEVIMGASPFKIEGYISEDRWDILNTFITETDSNSSIRWGYTDDKGEYWGRWHDILCGKTRWGFSGSDVIYLIEGHDNGYRLKENKTKLLHYDKLVSSMVSDIASNNVMASEVVPTSAKETILQGSLNDGAFLFNELIPRAYNGSSYCYVCYFKDGNRLVFEPLETSKVYKSYNTILRGTYRTNQAEYANKINVEYRWYNVYKREFTSKKINDNNAGFKKLSRRSVNIPDSAAEFKNIRAKDKSIYEEVIKADWSQGYYEMFDFVVLTEDPEVEVNRIIEVNVSDPDEKRTLQAGRYIITKNVVTIEQRQYKNEIYISRRTI